MPFVAVADTSPIFYLARLYLLSLLPALYGSIAVPVQVWEEAIAGGRRHPDILPELESGRSQGWITIHPPLRTPSPRVLAGLDPGEREAILLARHLDAAFLLIDDLRGRATAETLGLAVKGTLAVLADAKAAGLLSSLAAAYRALRTQTTFRFSRALEETLLRDAGERPLIEDPDDA